MSDLKQKKLVKKLKLEQMKHKYVVELYMLNSLDKKAQQETDHQEYNKKLEIPKLYLSEI